jgi:hypothetical protein
MEFYPLEELGDYLSGFLPLKGLLWWTNDVCVYLIARHTRRSLTW